MTEQHVTTAGANEIYWRYSIPRNTDSKMLLLNLGGVAVMGNWYGKLGEHFLGWCPLPKRHKGLEKIIFGGLQINPNEHEQTK